MWKSEMLGWSALRLWMSLILVNDTVRHAAAFYPASATTPMGSLSRSIYLLPGRLTKQQPSLPNTLLEFGCSSRTAQVRLQAQAKRTTAKSLSSAIPSTRKGTQKTPSDKSSLPPYINKSNNNEIAGPENYLKMATTQQKVKLTQGRGGTKMRIGRDTQSQTVSQEQKRAYRRELWKTMLPRLEAFVQQHGHARVTADHGDTELYAWTRHLRRQYRHQATHYERYLRPKNTTTTTSTSTSNDDDCTIPPVRKPRLSQARFQQLQTVGFCWDYRLSTWDTQYQELVKFYEQHGHTRVSTTRYPQLGVFCQNQRQEYRRVLLEQYQRPGIINNNTTTGGGSTTTLASSLPSTFTTSTFLTQQRLEALNKIQLFAPESYRSRDLAWQAQYNDLVQYSKIHGHVNVPQKYQANFQLGQWCMNQRTFHRFYENQYTTGMTQERIQKLSAIGFEFQYREGKWRKYFQWLKEYQDEHGHINIPTSDIETTKLRLWLNLQRHWYNQRQKKIQQQPQGQQEDEGDETLQPEDEDDFDDDDNDDLLIASPLTQERIDLLELIPNFSWRTSRNKGGPSKDDWSQLFEAIRDKGIVPGSRAKQHMFDGMNPLERMSGDNKQVWTQEELLALWHAEEDDDDDDEFDMNYTRSKNQAEAKNDMMPRMPPR